MLCSLSPAACRLALLQLLLALDATFSLLSWRWRCASCIDTQYPAATPRAPPQLLPAHSWPCCSKQASSAEGGYAIPAAAGLLGLQLLAVASEPSTKCEPSTEPCCVRALTDKCCSDI